MCSRVCHTRAVVSLADAGHVLRMHFSRLLPNQQIPLAFLPPRPHVFDGEHCWEIGKRGYALDRLVATMAEAGFALEHTFRPSEDVSQRFFRLRRVS